MSQSYYPEEEIKRIRALRKARELGSVQAAIVDSEKDLHAALVAYRQWLVDRRQWAEQHELVGASLAIWTEALTEFDRTIWPLVDAGGTR